ncbi:NADH-quinone oxidoreductase subunit NuoI [Candidatus Purcelliella pentastirinorum]|uniref:NADH-quinone oxidoreductase subunit I n=1 Tax=Candidatus Purcelliella pentastirinorum TaxID=472834 RepID=A0AAX3N6Z7_9ENTR|nr:NADH-quinone oxidoreductase subunit NuoI [Candidatus Purcelliella pentastirinorum]WDI78361.1 NADH-quinone oxidoreductase subunit NuoI [Candidatus Purcelliella pentastirinorum]WDR80612.1 NADH-quinone oxidoreductase subunit NuoI [Candidatus Purcelliella pentastirinorum]
MKIKKIIITIITCLKSMWIISKNIFSKPETIKYPYEKINLSTRYRGRIILTRNKEGDERCVACNLCSAVCPVSCIALQKKQKKDGRWYPKFFRINFSRCIFCGFCEEACPTKAIQLIPDVELSEYKRSNLIYEKNDLLTLNTGKYKKYDFYKITGIQTKNKKKGEAYNENKPIDVKKILP